MPIEIFRQDDAPVPISPLRAERLHQAVRRYCLILGAGGVIAVVLEIIACFTSLPSPIGLALHGKNPFWLSGLTGVSVLFFWSRPRPIDFRWMVVGGLLLTVALWPICRLFDSESTAAAALNLGIGLSALATMAWQARTRTGAERDEVLALCLPAFTTACSSFLLAAFFEYSPLRSATLDAETYAAEATLGGQPSFLLGQFFVQFPIVMRISQAVYMIPAFVQLTLLGCQIRSRRPPLIDVYTMTVAIAIFFSTLCLCFPLVGPWPAFQKDFPFHPPAVSDVLAHPLTVPDEPRNCMPSGHTAWALLIWWHTRPFGRTARCLGFFNLFFTVLATVGLGAHYLLDLIVAVPYAVMVQAICTPAPPAPDTGFLSNRPHLRREAIICGAVLTAIWLALILYGRNFLAISPILVWALALVTVVFPLLQEYALYRRMQAYEKSLVDEVPAQEKSAG